MLAELHPKQNTLENWDEMPANHMPVYSHVGDVLVGGGGKSNKGSNKETTLQKAGLGWKDPLRRPAQASFQTTSQL